MIANLEHTIWVMTMIFWRYFPKPKIWRKIFSWSHRHGYRYDMIYIALRFWDMDIDIISGFGLRYGIWYYIGMKRYFTMTGIYEWCCGHSIVVLVETSIIAAVSTHDNAPLYSAHLLDFVSLATMKCFVCKGLRYHREKKATCTLVNRWNRIHNAGSFSHRDEDPVHTLSFWENVWFIF